MPEITNWKWAFRAVLLFGLVLIVSLHWRQLLPQKSVSTQIPELQFDGQRALDEATALVEKFGPRFSNTEDPEIPGEYGGNLDVAQYVAQRFRDFGYDNPLIENAEYSDLTLYNVTTAKNWHRVLTEPDYKYQEILVAAHHDTAGSDIPGAEDNASSVGVLFELARIFKDHDSPISIQFVIFDGEELGGLGSREYERRYDHVWKKRKGEDVVVSEITRAVIATEMLGWKKGVPVLHTLQKNFAAEADYFVPSGLPQRLILGSQKAGYDLRIGEPWMEVPYQALVRSARPPTGSDDIWFLKAKIPALFMSTSSFFNFYEHYHLKSDTPDKLSAEVLEKSGRILEAGLYELDAWLSGGGSLGGWGEPYFIYKGQVLGSVHFQLFWQLFMLLMLWVGVEFSRTQIERLGLAMFALCLMLSAELFYPAALVSLAGYAFVLWLLPILRNRWANFVLLLLGSVLMAQTVGVLLMARWAYGKGFRVLVPVEEWALLISGMLACVLVYVTARRPKKQKT